MLQLLADNLGCADDCDHDRAITDGVVTSSSTTAMRNTETEHALQGVVAVMAVLHVLCGAAAGAVAVGKGNSAWQLPALKVGEFSCLSVCLSAQLALYTQVAVLCVHIEAWLCAHR